MHPQVDQIRTTKYSNDHHSRQIDSILETTSIDLLHNLTLEVVDPVVLPRAPSNSLINIKATAAAMTSVAACHLRQMEAVLPNNSCKLHR